ncbi:hypothetical protein [Photorhabdus khanii]
MPLLTEFCQKHPELKLNISFSELHCVWSVGWQSESLIIQSA